MTVRNHGKFILISEVSLGDQAISTMTGYSTQSHYPVIETTSPCPILIMLSAWLGFVCLLLFYVLATSKVISGRAWLGSNPYQVLSHWFDLTRVHTYDVRIPQSPKTGAGCSTHSTIPSGRPSMEQILNGSFREVVSLGS